MIEELENSLLITGAMLIGNANALLEDGRKLMTSGKLSGEVVFDLAGVKETDSSALSVLLSLMRTARAQGMRLRITHPPASILSLAQTYGISDLLPFA